MRLLVLLLVLAPLPAAVGCGDKGGVAKPENPVAAPDKSDPGLKGDKAPGPP